MCACQGPSQQGDREVKRNPLITETISNHHVNAFAEDGKGHVWIATFRGLNKFDGHQYQQYFCNDDSTGLPDNQIRDILVDRQDACGPPASTACAAEPTRTTSSVCLSCAKPATATIWRRTVAGAFSYAIRAA
ncbi:two-component regulator propeller domain-containing protein [Segatella baroniae]|uniref:two-component regulator propeller domain-containing protein n=1 Tax=Segatella baroniae TaxID=305719 RepID=UPI00138E559A|nr:two-component regulator propeller domain-containing protein [Segatella baroniae]